MCEIGLPAWQCLINSFPAFCVVRHLVSNNAILLVLCANLNLLEAVEHVAFHHDELSDAVYHDCITQGNEVEPTTTTIATRYCAILMTNFANLVSCFVEEFNRERSAANTSRVSLEDAKDLTDTVGCNAKTCADATADGVA